MTADRFRVRRRVAVTAFVVLVAMVPATFLMIAIGGQHMGEKLLQGSSVLGPVTGCLTAIVWKYFGDVTKTDLREMKNAKPSDDRSSD